jgi:hypothetical protein
MSDPIIAPYQWDLRPQIPTRPEWFRAWPDGAMMAVQILILNEWESVPRHRRRPMAVDLQSQQNKFDFLALGVREYGARHGILRLLDVLDKHGVKATIPTNGLTAQLFPATVRASHDRGHEVAAHQWDMSVFPPMFTSREAECSALAKTVAAIENVIGAKVGGYLSPGPRPTAYTLDILTESGFLWTSDYVDSDFPYLSPATTNESFRSATRRPAIRMANCPREGRFKGWRRSSMPSMRRLKSHRVIR